MVMEQSVDPTSPIMNSTLQKVSRFASFPPRCSLGIFPYEERAYVILMISSG